MKKALLTNLYIAKYTGSELHIIELAKLLLKREYEVTIAVQLKAYPLMKQIDELGDNITVVECQYDELKEKVAANFNTAKADAVLEKAGVENEPAQNNITKETNVLVLCAGGGTSGLLANALNKAAKEYNVPVKAAAGGYGAHREMLPEFDLVILAPQVASNYEDMKAETDKLGIKLAKTEGAQYIKLTRDGQGALAFVQAQFEE